MSATIPTVQEASSLEGGSDPEIRRHSAWRVIAGNPLALAGMVVVAFWALLAVFAPFVTHYNPITYIDIYHTLAAPNSAHWLGTDDTGRDQLSRLAFGGRASLGIGVIVVLAGVLIGLLLGGIAGFVGGVVDELIMRIADIVFSFPIIILALAVSAALGPSLTNAAIAMI